jgi:hypothetical protein
MTQALYAHMNNKIKFKKSRNQSKHTKVCKNCGKLALELSKQIQD